MAKRSSNKIDTVPFPEMPRSFDIPPKLLAEFKKDIRVVIRHPWIVGIPVPIEMLKPELVSRLRGTQFEVMLVPR